MNVTELLTAFCAIGGIGEAFPMSEQAADKRYTVESSAANVVADMVVVRMGGSVRVISAEELEDMEDLRDSLAEKAAGHRISHAQLMRELELDD